MSGLRGLTTGALVLRRTKNQNVRRWNTVECFLAPRATMTFNRCYSSKMVEGKEIQIPAPYGHIAAKEYGSLDGHPVLAVHGWLDNCGSFEPLIPRLLEKNNLHIIAMDEPGCGFSTTKPPGCDFTILTMIKDMKRVVNFFQWKEFSLIGHSRGGAIQSIAFASIFPTLVRSVTAIDAFTYPYERDSYPYTGMEDKVIDMHLKLDDLYIKNKDINASAPVYTEETAIQRIMTGNSFGLTEKEARILMKRGTKPYKSGLIFARDLRHKLPSLCPVLSASEIRESFSRMKCDLLVVMATNGPFSGVKYEEDYLEIYRKNCRTFERHMIEGNHYIHMQNTEQVSGFINNFLGASLKRGPVKLT